jgi:hypothetical protein
VLETGLCFAFYVQFQLSYSAILYVGGGGGGGGAV